MNPHSSLVLTLSDRATRSISEKLMITPPDENSFSVALGVDVNSVRYGHASYELESKDIAWINQNLGLNINECLFYVQLDAPHPIDELPYEVHTGRELRLMLAGTKPLAVFSDSYPTTSNDFWIFPEDVFATHVNAGKIVQREYIDTARPQPAPFKGIRVLLYALASEQWRIDAYIAMRSSAAKSGWNDGFERLEGTLLGYEEWQIDFFQQWSRSLVSQ